jgi:putative addiction module component (TIGR02574 family)
MTDQGNAVVRDALALPADERAQVAADMVASLDDQRVPVGEVTAAWAVEIERQARQVPTDPSAGEDWESARERIADGLRRR